jgi:hypothetical protein
MRKTMQLLHAFGYRWLTLNVEDSLGRDRTI